MRSRTSLRLKSRVFHGRKAADESIKKYSSPSLVDNTKSYRETSGPPALRVPFLDLLASFNTRGGRQLSVRNTKIRGRVFLKNASPLHNRLRKRSYSTTNYSRPTFARRGNVVTRAHHSKRAGDSHDPVSKRQARRDELSSLVRVVSRAYTATFNGRDVFKKEAASYARK